MSVEGPVSASPFPVNMVELTLCRHHHNLANALTLHTPVRATVSCKCHDAWPKFADHAKLKCMYDILIPPCTYRIPLTGMLA